jgi:anti-sigma B factor antagonist
MFVTVQQRDAVSVVVIDGNIDSMTAPRLSDKLNEQVQEGQAKLVADFGTVGYISSAGLRALLATLKQARQEGGDLRLAAVSPLVYKVFEMSGFTGILKFYDGVEEAVESFSA